MHNIILFNSRWLFITMVLNPSFFNVVLNGLKQKTIKVCTAWDVCEGRVLMFNTKACDCSIVFDVKCETCPSRIKKMMINLQNPICN